MPSTVRSLTLLLFSAIPISAAAPAQTIERSSPRAKVQTPPPAPKAGSERLKARPATQLPERKLLITEEDRRQNRIRKCKQTGGAWTIYVKGLKMTASGSDVDELYGTIYAIASNQGGGAKAYRSTVIRTAADGGRTRPKNAIWFSHVNANVGRDGGKSLAQITIEMRGQPDRHTRSTLDDGVSIDFAVMDEDGGRGGSDDDAFLLTRGSQSTNSYFISTRAPSCEDAPDFDRNMRTVLPAKSKGNNVLDLHVSVRWVRNTGV